MIEGILEFFSDFAFVIGDITLISEYLTLIFSLYFFKVYKIFSFYNFFLIYLALVVIVETIGFIKLNLQIRENYYEFDIFGYLEYLVIAKIYYNLSKNKKQRKVIIYSVVLYTFLHSILFYNYSLKFYLIILESVFIVYLVINYFIRLLNSKEILNYRKQLPFWLSVGFLLFFLSAIPFFSLQYSELMKNRNLFPILHVLILLYNGCFIYGLITCRRVNL